ncbi:MAG: efflux RND transporter periplasmic adaptor subunit [Bacteroidales bacterium]|jgi:membrane fusion protein (multidrug efflux system)|nr:efflux RND transporter periplasmic adaptor subunit [Bacteroidales bacterium]MDD3702127.1 efflux RND transporter periplasmic adaptor subunit [Bacteroidales bacterium]MDY0369585.1 efflux RND transporter periplasmic adaptor subunit [Bacteroidales bacterium]
MTKKIIKRSIGVLLTIGVLLLLFFNKGGFFSRSADRSALTGTRQQAVLPVRATVVYPEPMKDLIVVTGSLLPDEQVELSAEASGRIETIYFEEGRPVKKGDLLVTINNADLQAQISRNEYQLKLAKDREARQRILFEREAISQQNYDQVVTEMNSLQAEAELLQAQLDKTMIKAPFDGVLGLRLLSEGSYVSPGTKIVRLARSMPLKIDFSVPERYASYIHIGTPLKFRVENHTGNFDAVVYAVEPVIDPKSRSLNARALYPNEKGHLVPGTFARIEIAASNLLDALQVPAEAIIPEMGTNKVFVYRNGLAQQMLIVAGLRTESHVQILEGLQSGDTVLTSGLLQLRSGMPVELSQIR